MRVQVTMSGGAIGAIRLIHQADTRLMNSQEAFDVAEAVLLADFFNRTARPLRPNGGPVYRIFVTDGEKSRSLVTQEDGRGKDLCHLAHAVMSKHPPVRHDQSWE